MISVKVANGFLDLGVNATGQIERNTSLLLGDEILGELSLPMNIPNTENNARKLGFITNLGTVKTVNLVKHENVEYYSNNILMFRGTLVAEFVNTDLLTPRQGSISIYFLTAISAFYSMCSRVNLRDIDLGGDRVITNFTDHAMALLENAVNYIGYTFAPIYNVSYKDDEAEKGTGIGGSFMNPIVKAAGPYGWTIDLRTGRDRMAPQIYLSYLIKKCFSHFGYNVDGSIFSDYDFNKAILPSYQSIYWATWKPDPDPEKPPVAQQISPVIFNLKDHVPRDYSISRFLIAVFNYFGIAPIFDSTGSRCTLVSLNTLEQDSTRKDFSRNVTRNIKTEFEKVKKVYGLQLTFDDRDKLISKPDLSKYTRLTDIATVDQLPPATEALDMHLILIKQLNWFYHCAYQSESRQYQWVYIADNIYDYIPDGVTENITTELTPVSLRAIDWQDHGGGSYSRAWFGSVDQEGNWPGKRGAFLNWGLRIMFYHGKQPDSTGFLSNSYPFASSHIYNIRGEKIGNYSLALNPDNGIVNKYWSKWLDVLGSYEIVTLSYNLTFAQYLGLSWTDLILIRNVMLINIQQTVSLPWRGTVDCKAVRVVKTPCNAALNNITITYTGGTTAQCDFTESAPGAKSWIYAIDGGEPTTIYKHPFTIPAGPGNHQVTISPLCGSVPNPEGASTANYTIKSLDGSITYSCSAGSSPQQGAAIIHIEFATPTTVAVNLLFGIIERLSDGSGKYIGNDIFNPPVNSAPSYPIEDAHAPFLISVPAGTTSLTTSGNIVQKGFTDDGVHVWSCQKDRPVVEVYISIDKPVPLRANFSMSGGIMINNV